MQDSFELVLFGIKICAKGGKVLLIARLSLLYSLDSKLMDNLCLAGPQDVGIATKIGAAKFLLVIDSAGLFVAGLSSFMSSQLYRVATHI